MLPTHTRRSQESHSLQQFSTPLEFAYVASVAAGVTANDVVLEPSAGTGMLAIFAELAGAKLVLNEWAETRAGLLKLLFPGAPISRFDGAQVHDRLDPDLRPSVVLMNPPFSSSPLIEGRHAAATFEHIRAALARLEPGGRLVAITGESFAPTSPAWRAGFERLQEKGKLVFTAPLARGFFARHGTSVESRLTVFDKAPAEHPPRFVEGRGPIATMEELLALVLRELPPRVALSRNGDASPALPTPAAAPAVSRSFTPRGLGVPDRSRSGASQAAVRQSAPIAPLAASEIIELSYETRHWSAPQDGSLGAGLYEPYAVQAIVIADAKRHPTTLVQSAAMASVAPPKPSYRPHLPKAVIESGLLLDYLAHSFPTQLYEVYSDEKGDLQSRPVIDENGNPVQSREAMERRDRLIEHLAALPAVQGALDQIVQRFGTEMVAEVTGRSRRIVRKTNADGSDRLCVENRPASTNLGETQAFMDDEKRILVFSDAGGTGRSYHAERSAKNRRLRVHYLLEPGWKADNAIQGLGRTNRTNQAQPPLFRPVATDVKGEKRFLSTIARRLDTLGAITRGQRQTGGQGLFRPEDNLESIYGRMALRQLYCLLYSGKVEGCSLTRFEEATGLDLTDQDGSLKEELPPISTFLNRILALPIALQNRLFEVFEGLMEAAIEGAVQAGTFDIGVETVTAESLVVTDRKAIATHERCGAQTSLATIARKDKTQATALDEALGFATASQKSRLMINTQSGRAAVKLPAPGLMQDDGTVQARVRLLRPMHRDLVSVEALERSHWREATPVELHHAWEAELGAIPEFAESTFHIVTGLLLPVWNCLPDETARVYRLQTDAGERIIGRLVSPASAAVLTQLLSDDAPALSADQAIAAVMRDGASLVLAEGLVLKHSLVMNRQRLEQLGFSDSLVERLKALGLVSEIIAWKLRLFVPLGDEAARIVARILDRYPLLRVAPSARVVA